MVLFAFVSCCGASSRLVNFLTIKVLKFYFIFDLNFYVVYFFLFGLILVSFGQLPGQLLQLGLRASKSTCFHALSVTKCQMLRWGFKQLFYYFCYWLITFDIIWPFIAGVKRLISCHQHVNFTWTFLFFSKTSQVQDLFLSNNISSPLGGGLLTVSLCEKMNFKHTAISRIACEQQTYSRSSLCYLSGLSRAHFFRQPFSKLPYKFYKNWLLSNTALLP